MTIMEINVHGIRTILIIIIKHILLKYIFLNLSFFVISDKMWWSELKYDR